MRIASVLAGEILAPVVAAQTFPLLRRLRSRGHHVTLVVAVSLRRWLSPGRYAEAFAEAREAAGGRLEVVPHLPGHRWPPVTAHLLARALRAAGPEVVHARQARAAALVLRPAVAPVVADLRGLRPEEYLLAKGRREEELGARERREIAALRADEASARAGSASIVCVSGAFARRLRGGTKVFVVPNAAEPLPAPGDAERAALRRELGVGSGRPALVYSGSLAPWQCARETVRLFRAVRELRPEATLTLLVHEAEAGRRLLHEEETTGSVLRLSPVKTREALAAFDGAFLLRRRDPVNEVSCPVKWAEYLHAGLAVVLTEGIGDASGWTREGRLGVVLPDPEDPDNARRVADELPLVDGGHCREFARERLTFERTAALYEVAFRHAVETGPCGSA